MDPKVSILIPLYNSAKFISQTIESCLNQAYKNLEVIVVDDGSTDGSFEVARQYSSENVRVYKQENKGACAARNHALAKSSGDFIQFLDADDLLSENKIADQIKLISDDELSISSCSWRHFIVYPYDVPFAKEAVFKSYECPIDFLVESWSGGGMMQTACWLMSRKLVINAGPWNEGLRANPNDDGEYFCRVLLQAKKVLYSEKSKVFYRTPSAGNVSKDTSYVAAESLLGSYISYEKSIIPLRNTLTVKKAIANNYHNFAYRFYGIYPELSKEALNRASSLGLKTSKVGGPVMQVLIKILGLRTALESRLFLKKIIS